MFWNSRRIWLWLMIVMAVAGARPAFAQITEQVNMADANNDFEYFDAVNKNTGTCLSRTITNNNDPSDPFFSENQFCSTSIIRVGDSMQWNAPPSGEIGGGPHGTESGNCVGINCSPSPPTPYWMDTSSAGGPPFTVSGTPFDTPGVYPYFCTVHFSAMTGTVIVQNYSLSISPAAQWAYVSAAAAFTGTATAFPNATIPANGASAAYSSSVTLSTTGSALNETSDASVPPSVSGKSFNVGDTGESAVGDYTISVNGFGLDASHLQQNSNTATLHVVQLTLGAVSPSSVTIAPTDAVGKTATFSVTDNGTFPGTLTPTCSGVPAGVTCNFSAVTAGTHTITMTITTSGVVSGTYPATVVINPGSGLAQKSTPFTLVVEDFTATLSSASAQTIPPGGTATFNGTLTPVGGYTGTVTLSCNPAAPAGATCPGAGSSAPISLPGGGAGGSAPFTVTFVDSTFLGSSSFNVRATGSVGPVVHDIPVTVNVGGFSLGSPSITTIGDTIGNPSQTMTFQIIPTGSFNASVTLSCTGGAAPSFPAGATCKFYPSNVIALSGSAVTVTLVVTTTSATAANTYNFNVHGAGGGSTSDLALKLNVMAGAASIDLSVVGGGEVLSLGPTQLAGAPLTFKYIITNTNGSSTATTATALIAFTVPVPSPVFKDVTGNTTLSCSGSGSGPYTCPVASIAANGSRTISATVTAPFVRSMTASTQVSSPDTDTNQANNTVTSVIVQIRLRPVARKGLPAKLP